MIKITAFVCSVYFLKLSLSIGPWIEIPLFIFFLFSYIFSALRPDRKAMIIPECALTYFLITLFFFWGLFNSGMIYYSIVKDIINMALAAFFMFVLSGIYTDGLFKEFKLAFARFNVILFFPVSMLCLYKFYQILNGVVVVLPTEFSETEILWASLKTDYNMTAFGMLTAFVSAVYLFKHSGENIFYKIFYIISSMLFIVNVLLSGSRRALVIILSAAVIVALFLVYKLVKITKKLIAERAIKISLSNIILPAAALLAALWVFGSLYEHIYFARDFEYIMQNMSYRYETLFHGAEALRESRGPDFNRALEMINNLTLPQLLLGNGFDYLKTMSDVHAARPIENYPHNPVISGVLYGGMINAALIAFALLRSSYLYIRYRRKEVFFFILFALSLLFSFISANTIFSIRSSLILMMMPYLFRLEHKTNELTPSCAE